MSTDQSGSTGLKKGLLAAIFGLSVILTGIIPGHFAAAAGHNPNVVVEVTSIVTRADGEEQPGAGLKQWNEASLNFTWDATQANVQAGDYFTIDLPEVFDIPNTAGTFSIETNGKTAGDCTLAAKQIKCTFTKDQAAADAEKLVLKGSGKAIMRATTVTKETTVQFVLNGVSKTITLPGTKGIAPTVVDGEFYQEKFGKNAETLTPEKNQLKWTIPFGLAEINKLRAAANLAPLESGAVSTIEFHDRLSAGQSYVDRMRIERYRKANNSALELIFQNYAPVASLEGFTIETTYNETRSEATYRITGPFTDEASYYFMYWTEFDGNKPKTGVEYSNEVQLVGTQAVREQSRTAVSAFEITVSQREGYGTFNVLKFLTGDAAILAPSGYQADGQQADGKYQLHVHYVIPEAFTPKDPGEFTPPGTYDAGTRTGELDIPIAPGKKFTFEPQLPEGTVVTLTEKPVEAVANAQWKDESFSVTGKPALQGVGPGKSVQFTIADRKNYGFKLTNTLEYKTGVIKLSKTLSGITPAPADKQITFNYSCTPSGKAGKLVVTAGGPAVASEPIHYGDTCTITEDSTSAAVEGYDLKPVTIPAVTIDAAEKEVTVNNEYTPTKGLFSIKKVVVGTEGNDGAGKQFTVEANCTGPHLAQPKKLSFTVGDDTTIPSEELPVGTSCEISEDQTQVAIDGYNFVDVAFSTNPVVVTKTPQVVTVTNTYAKPKLGNFRLSKVVAGATVADDREFTVTATCTNVMTNAQVTEELKVSKGTPETLKAALPVGSTCTFTEDTAAAAVAGHTLRTHVFEPAQVTIAEQPVAVTLTNTYEQNKSTFKVLKTVAGDLGKAKDKAFKFTYTCTAPAGVTGAEVTGELSVVAGGPAATAKEIPQGYTCEVTESATEAQLDGFTLANPAAQQVVIGDTAKEITFHNAYTAKTGNLSLSKVVTGATVPDGKTFSVAANCTNALTGEKVTETLTVKPGTPVSLANPLPLESTCTFSEDLDAAAIDRHTLSTATFAPAEAVIGADPVAVTLTNAYTLNHGTFKVAKTVAGDLGKAKDKAFKFTYTCTAPAGVTGDAITGELTVVAGAPAVASKQIPEGYTCKVSETVADAQLDGFTLTAPAAQDVAITTTEQELSFVNAYSRVLGNLVISKQIVGAEGADDHQFTVNVTCTNVDTGAEVTEKLAVSKAKSASLGQPLPVGSTCTFAEDKDSAALDGYEFLGDKFSVENVTIGATETAVILENSYSVAKLPKDKPKQPLPPKVMPKPKPQLPKTGVSADAVFVAAGLATAGGLLLILRRKQSEQ